MLVKDLMTQNPVCCAADTDLQAVAQLMTNFDCGEIPVCDETGRPIGVVTDRDIICRMLARGENPLRHTAADCMSQPVFTVSPEASLEEAARVMESHQVRRLPVVDSDRICCGILAQADIATTAPPKLTAEVVERLSQPAASPGG